MTQRRLAAAAALLMALTGAPCPAASPPPFRVILPAARSGAAEPELAPGRKNHALAFAVTFGWGELLPGYGGREVLLAFAGEIAVTDLAGPRSKGR